MTTEPMIELATRMPMRISLDAFNSGAMFALIEEYNKAGHKAYKCGRNEINVDGQPMAVPPAFVRMYRTLHPRPDHTLYILYDHDSNSAIDLQWLTQAELYWRNANKLAQGINQEWIEE